jgi:hypothetical protein
MTDEFLASEASRLLTDRTFLRAIADMRLEALEALYEADAPDALEIHRCQAVVQVCDDLVRTLNRFMEAVGDD